MKKKIGIVLSVVAVFLLLFVVASGMVGKETIAEEETATGEEETESTEETSEEETVKDISKAEPVPSKTSHYIDQADTSVKGNTDWEYDHDWAYTPELEVAAEITAEEQSTVEESKPNQTTPKQDASKEESRPAEQAKPKEESKPVEESKPKPEPKPETKNGHIWNDTWKLYETADGQWLYHIESNNDIMIVRNIKWGLSNITVPSQINGLRVVELNYQAFNGYQGTPNTVVTIPGNIRTIRSQTFSGSTVGKIILQEGVTKLERSAIAGSGVKEVVLPNSLTSIEKSAFYNLSELTKVTNAPSFINPDSAWDYFINTPKLDFSQF